jgi:hypothetical protein
VELRAKSKTVDELRAVGSRVQQTFAALRHRVLCNEGLSEAYIQEMEELKKAYVLLVVHRLPAWLLADARQCDSHRSPTMVDISTRWCLASS